jgi:RecA-family ATPase
VPPASQQAARFPERVEGVAMTEANDLAPLVEQLVALPDDEHRSVAVQVQNRRQARDAGESDGSDVVYTQSLGEYEKNKPEMPPSLVEPEGLCVVGGVNVSIARSGKGKTVFNLNRLIAWAAGRALFPSAPVPLRPKRPLRSMIVENEGSGGMFWKQITTMLHNAPEFTDEQKNLARENLYVWGDGGFADVQLDSKLRRAQFVAEIEKRRPDIVFVEPMRMLWSGEENSATEMDKILKDMQRIAKDFNLAFLTAHHAKKGASEDGDLMSLARGSTALEGALTLMEHLTHISEGDQLEVEWSKVRYQEERYPKTFRMKWNVDTHWYEFVGEQDLDAKIMNAIETMQGRMAPLDVIKEHTGESYDKVRRRCLKLADESPPRLVKFVQDRASWFRIPGDSADEGLDY